MGHRFDGILYSIERGIEEQDLTRTKLAEAVILTRLELDFGRGTKGKRKRHLECILLVLKACPSSERLCHNHADADLFKQGAIPTKNILNSWP
ncbi:hypothetical protein BGW39_008628 [Mortierella sp. 14UC]|nr:hypothetical protein BGW39_008628 [Mortierella sp. 14UC]